VRCPIRRRSCHSPVPAPADADPSPASDNGAASWSATTAFVLGVVGVFMYVVGIIAVAFGALDTDAPVSLEAGIRVGLASVLCSAPAVILGVVGIHETARDPSRSGRDKANKGLVLGIIGVVFWVLAISALAGLAT